MGGKPANDIFSFWRFVVRYPLVFRARDRDSVNRYSLAVVLALHAVAVSGWLRLNVLILPSPDNVLTVSLLSPADEITSVQHFVPAQPIPVERSTTPVAKAVTLTVPADLAQIDPGDAPGTPTPAVPVAIATAPTVEATSPRFDAAYLDNPKPHYPALSRKLSEQGRVVLRVRVDSAGLALDVSLQTSSGFQRLDTSALETVRRWKFVPARLGSVPVAATVLVPIAFSLKE